MKDLLSGVLGFIAFALVGIGYIFNIVWMLDSWGAISGGEKFLNVAGVFFPPVGGILGIIHFF